MGYLNEFPHFEANTLNLDWILEQYSTFNKRLQELHDHFDEAVATMEQDISEFKTYVNNELTSIEHDFAEFTETVNTNFNTLSEELQSEISTLTTNLETEINNSVTYINNRLDVITDNMVDYVGEHITEWQAEASTITYTGLNGTFTCDKTLTEINNIITSGSAYKFKLDYLDLIEVGTRAGFPILEARVPITNNNDLVIGYYVYNVYVHNTTYTMHIEYISYTDSVSSETSITLSNNLGNNTDLIVDSVYKRYVTGGSGRRDYTNVTDDVTIYTSPNNDCVIEGLDSGYTYIVTYHFIIRVS